MSKQMRMEIVESDQPPELREDYPHFVVPRPDTPLAQCPSTIDMTTELGKSQLLAATGIADTVVSPAEPLRIAVTGYLVFPDSREDEDTGELKQFTRTVLLCSDGRTFASTSEVILKRLQAICQIWGRGPWDPPLTIHIACRIGRKSGRMFHDLRVEPRGIES